MLCGKTRGECAGTLLGLRNVKAKLGERVPGASHVPSVIKVQRLWRPAWKPSRWVTVACNWRELWSGEGNADSSAPLITLPQAPSDRTIRGRIK